MITLITGVNGTGKSVFVVSELQKIAATGRKIFVHNIPKLKIEHYRAGRITTWQCGTWLHIDQYVRTAPKLCMNGVDQDDQDDEEFDQDDDVSANWKPRPYVVRDDAGNYRRLVFDDNGEPVGSVEYENHQGALLVIDECQDYFKHSVLNYAA